MADSTLSALTASGALAGSELFYSDSGVADVKVTATQIKTWTSASPALVTPNIGTATGTSVTLSAFVKITAVAVASLPGSPAIGMAASVSDALAPVAGAAVSAGGSAKALVWYNGAQWTVIGV